MLPGGRVETQAGKRPQAGAVECTLELAHKTVQVRSPTLEAYDPAQVAKVHVDSTLTSSYCGEINFLDPRCDWTKVRR